LKKRIFDMSEIDRILLNIERQGIVVLLDFYNQRLEREGTEPQIMSAIDQLLELLLILDRQLNTDNDESGTPTTE
jgi:hypothetical protein